MNLFKKTFLGLAVLLLLGLVGATSSFAQSISCTANSVPTLVRSQGITELTGSIVLNCPAPAAAVPAGATLTVSIQPAAALVTNNPTVLPTITVDNGAAVVGAVNGNTVTFPVGALTAAAHVITIGVNPAVATSVGIRANIFASGVVFPSQVSALITSSPAGVVAITNNILNVAIPQPGLSPTTAFKAGAGIAQCTSASLGGVPTTLAYAGGTGAAAFTATDPVKGTAGVLASSVPTVTVVEGYNSAWAVSPAAAALNPGVSIVEGTVAEGVTGTRLVVSLGTLPSNVTLIAANYLSTTGTVAATLATAGNNTVLALVVGADANGNGGAVTLPATAATALGGGATVVTGNTVTYEVIQTSAAVQETIVIPVAIYTLGTPSPAGATTGSVQLGPVSTVGTAVTAPIPRFGAAPITGSIVSVIPCLTNILFPWVANVSGYDTGFAIANTTSDVFGTASQSGTCIYNFFGNNAPSGGTFTTASFGGGAVDTRLLSVIAPGFTGYVIVQCNFQLGHGFEFISNGFGGGAVTVGQGGPGLIILQPGATSGTSRKGLASAAVPFGEGLGH